MFRTVAKLTALASLTVVAGTGVYFYRHTTSSERKLEQSEARNVALKAVVERLTSDTRVADIVVTGQTTDSQGKLQTTLLFVGTGRDGENLPPRSFTIEGDTVHVEAKVIEFKRELVASASTTPDPLRGHAILIFTRLFGDHQSPAQAFELDSPGQVPDFYRGVDPAVSQFEQELWREFWQLPTDEALRQKRGVHVAAGKGVWNKLQPGFLYTLTIQPDGNLSSTVSKMPGIYREMLKAK